MFVKKIVDFISLKLASQGREDAELRQMLLHRQDIDLRMDSLHRLAYGFWTCVIVLPFSLLTFISTNLHLYSYPL